MTDLPPDACYGLAPQVLALDWLRENPGWAFRPDRMRCEPREARKVPA